MITLPKVKLPSFGKDTSSSRTQNLVSVHNTYILNFVHGCGVVFFTGQMTSPVTWPCRTSCVSASMETGQLFARQSCLVMERDQLFARQSSLASPLSWGDCALGRENSNNSLCFFGMKVFVYIYI